MPYRLCRHIKTNGLQCQSPALSRQAFCYHHDSFRRRARAVRTPLRAVLPADTLAPTYDRNGNFSMEPLPEGAAPANAPVDLGLLEDAEAVQVAISAVVSALAGNRMEPRRATSLLYGLQLAALNCRNLPDPDLEDKSKMLRETTERDGERIAQRGLLEDQHWIYDEDEEDAEPDGAAEELAIHAEALSFEDLACKPNRMTILATIADASAMF